MFFLFTYFVYIWVGIQTTLKKLIADSVTYGISTKRMKFLTMNRDPLPTLQLL